MEQHLCLCFLTPCPGYHLSADPVRLLCDTCNRHWNTHFTVTIPTPPDVHVQVHAAVRNDDMYSLPPSVLGISDKLIVQDKEFPELKV